LGEGLQVHLPAVGVAKDLAMPFRPDRLVQAAEKVTGRLFI
jgi:hypothetical protein